MKWSIKTTKASWIYVERLNVLVVKTETEPHRHPSPASASIPNDVGIVSICKWTRFHLYNRPSNLHNRACYLSSTTIVELLNGAVPFQVEVDSEAN